MTLSTLLIHIIWYSNTIQAEFAPSADIYWVEIRPEIKEELYYSKKRIAALGLVTIVITMVIVRLFVK